VNKNTFSLIKSAATFLQIKDIYQYQEFVKPGLDKALMIIAVIDNATMELTFAEISLVSGINVDTVAETIRALRLGGYPFNVRQAGTQGHKLLISKVRT
jgi:hypothetical protein